MIAVDGDTIYEHQLVRVAGYDAPEINGKCVAERALAQVAKARLKGLLNEAQLTFVPCIGNNYGRACGRLKWRGLDVAQIMVREGLAVPYECVGKCPRRINWCQ